MAGNIPLVGFHDFISALVSGHNIIIKQSSNDKHLLPYLVSYVQHLAPSLKGKIKFTNNKLEHFDAVIATGSNNTARYFEAYFKDTVAIATLKVLNREFNLKGVQIPTKKVIYKPILRELEKYDIIFKEKKTKYLGYNILNT